MESKYSVGNITEALAARAFPTVTFWNRLEGRPRKVNFDRALKAEVRDALWMLTRQWQMGEFRGDDAGSPIFAKIHLATTRLNKYQANGHKAEAFDENIPLEAKVGRRLMAFALGGQKIALDIRLLMGRQWLKMLSKVGDYARAYIEKYPIDSPDPSREEDAPLCAHPEVWQTFSATAGRRMDGASLYLYLKSNPTRHAHDGINVLENQKGDIDQLAAKFIQWFEKLFFQPPNPGEDAWDSSRLEYLFACSAADEQGEKVLTADEYYGGHLDWYSFDVDKQSQGLGKAAAVVEDTSRPVTQSLVPAPIVFEGMPNTRWWSFEDRKTNFGDIKPDTTDLA